jgi:hypothetical protein
MKKPMSVLTVMSRSISPIPPPVYARGKLASAVFDVVKPVPFKVRKRKRRSNGGVQVRTKGKTYFGNYFKKFAKKMCKIPMTDESKFVFDDLMYSLFDRLLSTAADMTNPLARLVGKHKAGKTKRTILKKRDLIAATRLLCGPRLSTGIMQHYGGHRAHLDFLLQSDAEGLPHEDEIDPAVLASVMTNS